MNIEKAPIYEMTEANSWVVAAKEEINALLAEYSAAPQAILNEYKKYEWIVQLDIEKYLTTLFSEKPTTETLTNLISDIRTAIYEVQNVSNDYVDFNFFQVESERLKFKVKEKGEKAVHKILKRISKYCIEQVNTVLDEYSNMKERLDTVPQSEEELFDLKSFYRNIKNLKLE
jgi:hypothetical protein